MELTLNQQAALSDLITKVTKLPDKQAWEMAKTMDMSTRNYLWAIFYAKKYDEFRSYIKDYKA